MEQDLIDLMSRLDDAVTVGKKWDVTEAFFSAQGAQAINYGALNAHTGEALGMKSTMPSDYMNYYMEQEQYFDDHLYEHMRSRTDVMCSGLAVDFNRYEEKPGTQQMLRDIDDAGYNCLMLMPVAGTVLGHKWALNFATRMKGPEFRKFATESGERLRLATHIVHTHLAYDLFGNCRDDAQWFSPDMTFLTERELEVLTRLASGMRNKQIADKLKIAEVTVNKHIGSATRKLGAATREQAVAVAVRSNFISI